MSCRRLHLSLLIAILACAPLAAAQAHWADPTDPDAKAMIEAERKWAVLDCEPSNVVAEALAESTSEKVSACKLISARVRFYGPSLAMIYGKETSTRTAKDGQQYQRTLIWTDTWLKRNGKWQIIAVQDMREPKS